MELDNEETWDLGLEGSKVVVCCVHSPLMRYFDDFERGLAKRRKKTVELLNS